MTRTRTTTPPPVLMPAADWRAAVLASDLPRDARCVAAQLAHFAVTDDATVIRPPGMAVLGECAELSGTAVLDALARLRRDGWTARVPDPDDPTGERSMTALCDPRGATP